MKTWFALLFLVVCSACQPAPHKRLPAVITETLRFTQGSQEYLIWTGVTEDNANIGGIYVVEWWNHGKRMFREGDLVIATLTGSDNGWQIEQKITSR